MALSLTPVRSDDPAAIDTYVRVVTAVRDHDVPQWRDTTPDMIRLLIEVPFPGNHIDLYLAWRAGEPVGRVQLELPTRENLDLMNIDIWVVPGARRQGIGRELYAQVEALAHTHQRKRFFANTLWELPGIPAPNLAGKAFAETLGFSAALPEVIRRLDMSTVDWSALDAIFDKAKAASADYRLVRWVDVHPDEYIDDLAYLDGRLMTDSPIGDLVFEVPKVDATRLREYQVAGLARERIAYHTAAVHGPSNRLVAWTTIARERSLPTHAFQQITIVEPKHRGHRLGALVKVENLRYFRENQPAVTTIDTFNAAENSYMIAINEEMGFRPLYAFQNWQREI